MKRLNSLSQEDKLYICSEVLSQLEQRIKSNSTEYKGTTTFYPVAVSQKVKDKNIAINMNENGDREKGVEMSNPRSAYQLDIPNKDWYVYEENYGTSEEKSFVKFVNSAMEKLKEKFEEIILLRNERLFKIHRFSDGSAIEPDFLLFLRRKEEKSYLNYQLFVEPKGEHLRQTDKWKEDFLKEVEEKVDSSNLKVENLLENENFKLIGMPFYTENQNHEFEEKWNNII
jgi:type III restriction enzyme